MGIKLFKPDGEVIKKNASNDEEKEKRKRLNLSGSWTDYKNLRRF